MAAAGHAHTHDLDVSARTRRLLSTVTIGLGFLVVVGMLLVGFGTDVEPTVENVLVGDVREARVLSVEVGPCEGTTAADEIDCRLVEIELTQGPDEGEARTLSFSVDSPSTPDLSDGDRVVVSHVPDAEPGFDYVYADRQRRNVLVAVALAFAFAVVLLGRLRGLAALAGIAISLAIILAFVLPGILEGHSPVLVAVLGSAAIAYFAVYLAHGINPLSTVALLGTLGALALTAALSATFTALAHFSGFASEEALVLSSLAEDVDISGLVLAGIVIGALGALDDVTVTQASAVAELREANPAMTRTALWGSAVRIGRDHIASAVNTLVLAYAGAALPIMLLFVLSDSSLGTIANSEVIAVEIVRALVGSIGLVAAVPITTWLASRVVPGPTTPKPAVAGPRPDAPDPDRDFWT